MANSCASLTLASEFIPYSGFCRHLSTASSCRVTFCQPQQRPMRSFSLACRAQSESNVKNSHIFTRRNAAISAAVLAMGIISNGQPAFGGILSGAPGLESVPSISIPQPDFLKKIADSQKQKYEDFDENVKTSPLLQQLLKKSEENREVNRAAIQNKYCQRGAEWGVGDCSLQGLTEEDKAAFFKILQAAQGEK